MSRLLFVCTNNRMRSKTASELVWNATDHETRSAGVAPTAERRVERDDVEWADVVIAMEDLHVEAIERQTGSIPDDTEVVVLGIPDRFPYMDPELVAILQRKLDEYL